MSLTQHSNIFSSLHESGINKAIKQIMRQRPSWFNFGTEFIAAHPEFLCTSIDYSPEVSSNNNPLISILNAIPIIGTSSGTNIGYGLDFAVQINKLEIDFYPGTITLPSNINPLQDNEIVIYMKLYFGLSCPSQEILDNLSPPPITIPTTQPLTCFPVDLYVFGTLKLTGGKGGEKIIITIHRISNIGLVEEPAVLNVVNCYLRTMFHVIAPKLTFTLKDTISIILKLFNQVILESQIIFGAHDITPNPAISDDQLKLFIDLIQIGEMKCQI